MYLGLKPFNFGQLQIATAAAPIGVTAPTTPFTFMNMPTGNLLIHDLLLSFSGNMNLTTSSAGTLITDGEKLFISGIKIYSDMHMDLMSNVDFLSLFRMNLFLYGSNTAVTSVTPATTGTPVYRMSARVPFAMRYGSRFETKRPLDSVLDLIKSRLKIQVTVGNSTAFILAGTYTDETVQVCNLDIKGEILDQPNEPANPASAVFPGYMQCFDVIDFPVTATAKRTLIPIPSGDGIIQRIYISQRNLATLAEVTNVIAATDTFELKILTESIMVPVQYKQLQEENAQDYNITVPASWVCIPFDKELSTNQMFDVRNVANGTLFMFVDVTTQTNCGLRIILQKLKPIPLKAERDYTIALRARAAAAA